MATNETKNARESSTDGPSHENLKRRCVYTDGRRRKKGDKNAIPDRNEALQLNAIKSSAGRHLFDRTIHLAQSRALPEVASRWEVAGRRTGKRIHPTGDRPGSGIGSRVG